MGLLIDERFRLDREMLAGDWGVVHQGVDLKTGVDVAIKLEHPDVKRSILAWEAEVHQSLSGGVGVPALLYQGVNEARPLLVMEKLGHSVHELVESVGGKFSLKTVLMLADQFIARLEYVHAKGFIHRDIKPQNFLLGLGMKCHEVSIIDFGFAKRYWDPKKAQHAPYQENQAFAGTPSFASVRAHLGVMQTRRDDLEALGYMMIYLLTGSLPWYVPNEASLHPERDGDLDSILKQKLSTPLATLCKDLPAEFHTYFRYCRDLHFAEKPDYKYLRGLFRDLFTSKLYARDYTFDWMGPSSSRLLPMEFPGGHPNPGQESRSTTVPLSTTSHTYDTLPTLV